MKYRKAIVRVGHAPPLNVLVADTAALRSAGLRGRRLFAEDGMLFVFPHPAVHWMTMEGMTYPLDMLFFDDLGTLLGVITAPPGGSRYGIPVESKTVLEVIGGWADRYGVSPGDSMVRRSLP